MRDCGKPNSNLLRPPNTPCPCPLLGPLLLSLPTLKNQIRSAAQSCPTLCDPMNHSTPGLPVHHQLPEFTQTHIH